MIVSKGPKPQLTYTQVVKFPRLRVCTALLSHNLMLPRVFEAESMLHLKVTFPLNCARTDLLRP